ncbi:MULTISPECIES: hypothetical protein [Enterococcus]|jgi:hypothetical protein|uniref:hypothetical protein n=1 Tax=Enterococcus TaxID=1350 RepID=UPI0008879AA5|nr:MULTISPECIES: hypothetical protein [Enterococcus]DAZ01803.1 MAG TPA: hypothetical protein [Caudoviricetes sp.]MBV6374229.1 hypothetical protein [Enterococcus casseliflavus]MDB1689961.1 hypothetical protein [Enterococcus casseliflavus]MDR3825617.1 hypothetical protein [Enterococcus sp.]MDT2987293.1 hypothetical protein [Enterococcus casseliflavus]
MRWTSITPEYDQDGKITKYYVSVDSQNKNNESITGQLIISADTLDLSEVLVVAENKIVNMLTKEQPE